MGGLILINKVISGGQTGVDRIGLEVANALGIPTGGTAPKNWWTDVGSDPSLKEFGLVESPYWGYPPRTEQNIIDCTGTLLWGNMSSPGCKLTIALCKKHRKPYIKNPTLEQFIFWAQAYSIDVLNVAGNRAKNLPQAKREALVQLLEGYFKHGT